MSAGAEIYVGAVDLPDFIFENYERLLHKEAVIAENKETKCEIRVKSNPIDSEMAIFRVFKDGKVVMTEDAIGEEDIHSTYKMLNLQYIFPVTVSEPEDPFTGLDDDDTRGLQQTISPDDEPDDDPDFGELVEECHEHLDLSEASKDKIGMVSDVITIREDDLIQATRDYLEALTEDDLLSLDDEEEDELISSVLEHILIFLSVKHGISVWRPSIYEGDNGSLYLDPFPYTNQNK